MRFLLTLVSVSLLAACPADDDSSPALPDAGVEPDPDAAPDPDPDAGPLLGYGEPCTSPAECEGDQCVGTDGSFQCSRSCRIDVAHDCRDVDAFCVPVNGGNFACFGEIETGADQDDAIIGVGDSATRLLSPLTDADLFQVRLDQLGDILFEVSTEDNLDIQLEAYGMLGDAIGIANNAGPGGTEALQTEVNQIGGHVFLVPRNVGNSTGTYTISVTELTE